MENKEIQLDEEIAEAKLRNVLSPLYVLADMVALMDEVSHDKRIDILKLIKGTAIQCFSNKQDIVKFLREIENKISQKDKDYSDLQNRNIELLKKNDDLAKELESEKEKSKKNKEIAFQLYEVLDVVDVPLFYNELENDYNKALSAYLSIH